MVRYWLICWFTIYFCRLTIDVGIICNRQRTKFHWVSGPPKKYTNTTTQRPTTKIYDPKWKCCLFGQRYAIMPFTQHTGNNASCSSVPVPFSSAQPANKQSHHHKTKAEAAIWKLSMRADIATSWAVRLLRLSCRKVSRKAGRQVVRRRAVPRCSIWFWWWTSVAAVAFSGATFPFLGYPICGSNFRFIPTGGCSDHHSVCLSVRSYVRPSILSS